ncbi:MAG: hypothetical protein QNJ13_12795 [Paracoccaceae bacterium]|nr:hypothetical protein [Paracoccaceae bacterium]
MIRALAALFLLAAPAAAEDVSYLQLQDRLDRPRDGYCLDVLGAGGNFRPDLPVNVHNCKPGNAPDGRVILRADGTLYMPAFNACVTAMGVNRTILPGAALILASCDARGAFGPSLALQQFELGQDGTLRVAGELCLTAGPVSGPTFSPSHAWRPLFVDACTADAAARQRWAFIAPYGS